MSKITYQRSEYIIDVHNGKIQFNTSFEFTRRVYYFVNDGYDTSFCNDHDIILFHAAVLNSQNKLSKTDYDRAWEEFFFSNGIIPAHKSIDFLQKKIVFRYCDIDDTNDSYYPEMLHMFLLTLYTALYNAIEKQNLFQKYDNKFICHATQSENTLYIYKGNILCQREHHRIISATALLLTKNENQIEIDVNYCSDCQKFFLNYESYKILKLKYGILLGNLKLESDTNSDPKDSFLSEASPLRLCGYNVNQIEGLSQLDRQYIISKILELGIMTKPEIVKYLEHFIHMNGKKFGNEVALQKWKEDLEFTHYYGANDQPKYIISKIEQY